MASSPPAIIGTEPTWVPYEPTRDCSQGLCSMYCPQWCYFIFPPPPPFDLAGPGPGHVFSPLVIAIIGVLATAFLLVSYYTFISKYCGTFGSLRRRLFGPGPGSGGGGGSGGPGSGHGQSRSQESWNVSPASGLDETLINKITVCKYRRGDGPVLHTTDRSSSPSSACWPPPSSSSATTPSSPSTAAPSAPSGGGSSAPAPAPAAVGAAAVLGAATGSPGARSRGTCRRRAGWTRP